LKQIGSREIEVYVANPLQPQSALSPKKLVSFTGPGTQTVVFNPDNNGSVLVAREKGEVILAGDSPQFIQPLTEYALALMSGLDTHGNTPLASFINGLGGQLLEGNTGLDQSVLQEILDNAKTKAKQAVYWRSEFEAWCQKTPACFDNATNSFKAPIPEGCCKANYDDWFKTTVTYTTSTELCDGGSVQSKGKFCNNLGYPSSSRNYNSTTGQCELPINPAKHNDGFVSCTPFNQANPATQAFVDTRCIVFSADPADFVSQNPEDEADNSYWLGKSAAIIKYGDSYKDSATASASVCNADFAKSMTQALNTSVYGCMQKNLYCPVAFGVDSNDNKKKPYCVPPNVTVNGLLSSDESNNVDVEDASQIAFAKFSDKGTSTKTDDVWLCEGGRIFAVRDTCIFENCNTYVFANAKNPSKPARCDATAYCRPDGTKLVENASGETVSLAEGELVKVKRSDSAFSNTPAQALAPFSLFPSAFQRGFMYSLPINTLASVDPAFEVFYNLGLVAPTSCKSGKTGSKFNGQGLFDLQLALEKNQNVSSWASQTIPFVIPTQSYQQIPCEEPLAEGDTQTCHLLFADARGDSDACLKSVTQFEFYSTKPPDVMWKDYSSLGVSLSEMTFSGRLGAKQGTKTFAITPTGYLVALREGYKNFQIFDWWKNDGTYGGAFALSWKKKNWTVVILGLALVVAGCMYAGFCGFILDALPGSWTTALASLSGSFTSLTAILLGTMTFGLGESIFGACQADPSQGTLCNKVLGIAAMVEGVMMVGQGLKSDGGCKEAVSTNTRFTVLDGDSWDPQEADARILGCRGENWALDDLQTSS
jgi:hypothetical protein